MNTMLHEQFLKLVKEGDEQAVKTFLVDHIKEFSEPMQNKIIAAFFTEALKKKASDVRNIAALQKELLEAFEATEKMQKIVADKKKELEIKEHLAK
jgi:hypothetical protein